MNKAIALAVAVSLSTPACTQVPVSTTTMATLTQAQADVQKALNLYGVAKGIAQVAAMADPTLAPVIAAGIAVADPLAATAQTALNAASADATSLEALVAQITAQANTLTVQAAAVVKVVPSVVTTGEIEKGIITPGRGVG